MLALTNGMPQIKFRTYGSKIQSRTPLNKPCLLSARTIRAMASQQTPEESSTTGTAASEEGDDLLIEQQMSKRRPKPKTPAPAPGSYKVISAARDQVYGGGPLTPAQQFENGIISFLSLLFFVLLGMGIFLAGSGFLSPEADQFAMDVIYPAFSPTLGFFLACSSLYGLWKTGSGRGDEEKKE